MYLRLRKCVTCVLYVGVPVSMRGCVCVCITTRTRGKQWIKQQSIYIPTPLPAPPIHRQQHITFIGIDRFLTLKNLWQNCCVSVAENVAKLQQFPTPPTPHTHSELVLPHT